MTLQAVGKQMRATPRFSESLAVAKLGGPPALERFIRLWPDRFEVDGPQRQVGAEAGLISQKWKAM